MIEVVGEAPPARLRRLAHTLARLAPSYRDPESYHLVKGEIVDEMRVLARQLDFPGLQRPAIPRVRPPPPPPPRLQAPPTNGKAAQPPCAAPAEPIREDPARRCRHCRKRLAQQSYRHRLKLTGPDLFQWARQEDTAQ